MKLDKIPQIFCPSCIILCIPADKHTHKLALAAWYPAAFHEPNTFCIKAYFKFNKFKRYKDELTIPFIKNRYYH